MAGRHCCAVGTVGWSQFEGRGKRRLKAHEVVDARQWILVFNPASWSIAIYDCVQAYFN